MDSVGLGLNSALDAGGGCCCCGCGGRCCSSVGGEGAATWGGCGGGGGGRRLWPPVGLKAASLKVQHVCKKKKKVLVRPNHLIDIVWTLFEGSDAMHPKPDDVVYLTHN
jgi:hypothetical protein